MKAIEIFLSHHDNNQSKSARVLSKALSKKIKQPHVWYWLNVSDMPLDYVPIAAKIIGLKPRDLRPDHYK